MAQYSARCPNKTTSIMSETNQSLITGWLLVCLNGTCVLDNGHSSLPFHRHDGVAYTRLIQTTSNKTGSSWRVPVNPSFVRARTDSFIQPSVPMDCILTRTQIHSLVSRSPRKEEEMGGVSCASEPARSRENGPRFRQRQGCTENTDRKMGHFY